MSTSLSGMLFSTPLGSNRSSTNQGLGPFLMADAGLPDHSPLSNRRPAIPCRVDSGATLRMDIGPLCRDCIMARTEGLP